MSQTRRLAAILAADVAGYSRLIGADEEGTLNRLRSIRTDVIDPRISENRGRIVKTTGDGLLVEFASVVDAKSPVRRALPFFFHRYAAASSCKDCRRVVADPHAGGLFCPHRTGART